MPSHSTHHQPSFARGIQSLFLWAVTRHGAQRPARHTAQRLSALLLALLALLAAATGAQAQYQVTTLGSAVVENFDGMQVPNVTATTNINFNAALGTTNQLQRNAAWVLSSTNGRGNDTGSNTSGGWWAYANVNTTTDKALGELGNGSLASGNAIATFLNTSGSTVTSFVLSYTGELWRGNTGNGSITVTYSVNGGTFTALANSTFTPTNNTNAAINGDASGNRTTGLGATVNNLNLASGQNIQFRFQYTVGTNSKGVAIDDISVTFNGAPTPTISSTGTPAQINTTYGSNSSVTSFSVNGTNMSAGILVTPPAGFQVSTDNSTFSSSNVTVGSSGTISSTPVYLRIPNTTAAGTYSGNITLTSANATQVNVATTSSTVSKATLTITAGNQTVSYGTAVSTVTGAGNYTATGFVNSETSSVIGGTASYTTNYTTTTGAGSNVATITPVTGNLTATNYSFSAVNGNISVTAIAPTIGSPTVTSVATTSATLGATVTGNGGAVLSARGTAWDTNASPTGNALAEGNTTVSAFTHSRTGLTANTLYYYRGYATNSAGTAYTADGNFTTLPLPPTVGTGSAATTSGFTANWTHPTMGSASYTYTVEVDNDSNFGSIDATVSSISSGSTTQAITGLSSSTTYYYRVKSVNTTGSSAYSTTSAGIATSTPSGTISTSGTLSAFSATYPSASAQQSFSVNGTNLTGSLTVAPPSGFEVSLTSGSGFGATATISANGTLASTTVYVRLAASTNAASYSGNVTISGGSATTQNVAIPSSTVSKATPTVSVAPTASAITYGQTLASSTITPGTSSVSGTYAFTTPATAPSVGTASQPVTFTPTDTTNYNTASTTASVTVNKATPTVSVAPTASGITYGQTLASSTLSGGTASVNGTFAFTTNSTAPAVGTTSQTVTFTPTDTANYNTASTTASVTVSKATPTVSVAPTASDITYGQTLANSTLSGGTASVNGTFAFSNSTISPGVGTASQNVTFTPTDGTNYNTASTNASVTVNKANPTLTFNSSSSTTINGTVTLNATSASTGAVTYTSSNNAVVSIASGVATGVAVGTATITASQAADSNYNAATANQTMTVTAAPVSLAVWNQTWSGTAASPLSANTTATGVTGSVTQVGLTGGSSSSRYSASTWNGSSTSTNYLSVTLNATSSYALNLNSSTINATWGSSNTGPASYAVYSSVNSFSAPVGTFASSNTTTVNGTITLPSSGYSNLSSIEFRVVGNATSANGASTVSGGTGGFSYLQFKGIISQNPPTVTAATINGTVGTALSANITVSNSPTGYAISSGTLPAGLSLNGTTGQISGTPTTAGNGTIVAVTATNGGGTSASANLTFNIAAILPTIGTPSVSSINTTTATLGATVTANGGETLSARGTAWGTSASPTGNSLAEGNTTVSAFTHSRTGLTANTLYYYRGYATNSAGTAYTADGNFTTLPLPPTVGTGSAVSASGFTANWSHPTMGAASYTYTLDFSTDNTFATGVTTVTGISSSSTSRVLTALNASTTYYYRVKAVNAQGSSDWSATSAGVSTSAALGVISTSGTLSAFTSTYPAASAEQSFTVSGSNLSGSLTVTAPAGFEVSLTSGSGFGSTATISASGTLASTTVYVRLPASATAGSYSGNVAVSGGDAATQNIAASGTVSQASQTITFGALATKNATDAAFALTATASSNLTVSYSSSNASVATVAGNTVTLVGAGSTTITASQAGNTNYAAATSVPQTLTVNKVAQTISGVTSTLSKTYGDAAYSLGASVGSGLTINYTSSNTSVATIAANGTVTIVSPGTTTLTASQAGDARYSAAADATQALTVSKATPTLSFNSSNSTTVNGTVTLNATSAAIGAVASTGAVTYTSSNTSVATISTSTLSAVASGTTTITASQAADSNYNSTTATQIFTVTTGPTTLAAGDIVIVQINTDDPDTFAFVPLVDLNVGTVINFTDNPWSGTALGTAEGTLTWNATSSVSRGTVVSYNGTSFSTGTSTSSGTVALSTSGDAIIAYQGTSVSPTFIYALASNTWITSGSTTSNTSYLPTGLTNGTSARDFTSELDNSYYNISSFTGNKSSIQTSVGNTTNWTRSDTIPSPAPTFSITVKSDQSITFGALSSKTYGDSTFSLTATASSSLSVSYASSNTSVATVAGSTVTVVGVGSTTITASQAGDSNYTAATNVTQTLTVSTKSLTGTFTANDKTYDGTTSSTVATRAVTGTVGSDVVNHTGGTATFANATVGNGKTVTLAGATLTGAAASNYSLGSVATTTANITQATPTVSVAPTASAITYGQTLASSVLSGGTASVPGTYAFTTPATAPSVGTASQAVTFTPTDSANYNTASTTASVTVNKATPTVSVAPTASGITYGQTLASSVLSGGTASTAGTYAFTTPATAPSAGTASQPVTFTPTDTASYNTASTTASVTVSQATPTISVAPTASNITIGQTLANSTLSGGNASVNGTFAFTTPSTAPALGISSQGVTFTPTDSTNYTTQTTSANVGVLCLAPTLTRATLPVAGGFTVNWNAATGAANYTVLHSASKNMTGATSVNTASTSLAITGLSNGLRYVQVRANNAAGASANSTQQVNQLQSIAAGATSYMSAPGEVGTNTVAGIFGSANEAGLASGATDSASTTILLLNSNGATANTIFYNSSVNQWREGANAMDATAIAQGTAFMLKNNTGSTDYFLLVGSPRTTQPVVSLNPAGNYTLCTTGRTTPTTIANMNLNPGTSAGQFKAATKAKDADKVIVVDQTTGAATNYYHNGTTWMDGLRAVPSAEIPAGQGFFIKKASNSTFSSWTLPAE